MDKINAYLSEVMDAILHVDHKVIEDIIGYIENCDNKIKKILTMGNGGSSTTASHFAGDLQKTCFLDAYCLSDSNYLITAHANDSEYRQIFTRQILTIGYKDDIVIAFSCSGLSRNIIDGLQIARQNGLGTIGITGLGGGEMKSLCDVCLIVPSSHVKVIEDVHLAICHCIVEKLEITG